MRLGLVVNPVAGLGGAVGLKGTDGPDTVAEALRRGAVPQAGPRAARALARLAARCPGVRIIAAPGPMGQDWAAGLGLDVAALRPDTTPGSGTARDTRAAVAAMADCDVIIFAGGDGTARDVAAALAPGQALMGIPCGVKMHSGVFAISPEAAGAMMADLMNLDRPADWDDSAEVMDIDETELRAGRLAPRLFGLARVPRLQSRIQAAKGGPRQDAASALAGAAAHLAKSLRPGTVAIIGPGTSAGAVMQAAGHRPTLLGTDALLDGQVLARDATARDLEDLAKGRDVQIVLGVTGRQGFLIGRGNQQISAPLITKAGRAGLLVLATEEKLATLAQPCLWVDTGDPALDAALAGFVRVQTGAGRQMMMRIAPAQ